MGLCSSSPAAVSPHPRRAGSGDGSSTAQKTAALAPAPQPGSTGATATANASAQSVAVADAPSAGTGGHGSGSTAAAVQPAQASAAPAPSSARGKPPKQAVLPSDAVISAMLAEAVQMARDSDYTQLTTVARSAFPDKATGTRFLVPKIVSTKRVRILGMAADNDESAASSRRTARVWVQAERLDVASAVRRINGSSLAGGSVGGRSRGTGAMRSVPSFTMSAKGAAPKPAAQPAALDEAALIANAARVYRVQVMDPSSDTETSVIVSTGPGGHGGSGAVLSLRGLVPPALLEPPAERALLAHLCEERTAHHDGAGGRLDLEPVSARSVGLQAGSGAPAGCEASEFVVEAKCDGATVSAWLVMRDSDGDTSATAGGTAPVPLVLDLETAARKAGASHALSDGDVTGALLAVAGRVALRKAAGAKQELLVVAVGEGEGEGAAAQAAAAESSRDLEEGVVLTEDGIDACRDTWEVAEADLKAVASGPFSEAAPPAAEDSEAFGAMVHSHTRRQPMVPTPWASKRATLLGLDGGPRSSPFEPRAGTGSASGSGRVRLVVRAPPMKPAGEAGALEPTEAVTGADVELEGHVALLRVSSVDPASSQERHSYFSIGATPESAAAGGAPSVDSVFPAALLTGPSVQALATHMLDDRLAYSELAARWWRREALLWPQMPSTAKALAAVAADGTTAASHAPVVRFSGATDAAAVSAMAAGALFSVQEFASAGQPLTLTPALARGIGLSGAGDEAAVPSSAESRQFVIEARCAGSSVVLRLVNLPAGALRALKASSRVRSGGLLDRPIVGRLAQPPPALVVPLTEALLATGMHSLDAGLNSVLLGAAERVALVRTDSAPTAGDDSPAEPEAGTFELRLVSRG